MNLREPEEPKTLFPLPGNNSFDHAHYTLLDAEKQASFNHKTTLSSWNANQGCQHSWDHLVAMEKGNKRLT